MRSQFPTPEQNHSLPISACGGSIESTTNTDANRKRYLSGIFLPKFYLSTGEHRPKSINFAVRLICGNKPSNRTNNANRSVSVVETLSHPIQQEQGDTNPLLTNTETNKMNPIQHTARNATTAPIVFTSDVLGVVYA